MSDRALLDGRVAAAFYGRFPALRPAQEAAINPLLNGQNVVLSSGTGSGKTEAVVAPLISHHWRRAVESDRLTFLYIAPTKALVNDLEKRLRLPLDSLGLRVGIRHGDRDDLATGRAPHFLITTPESLDVLLFRQDPALKSIRAVVIDEVHLLYNTQRGLQLSILLRRLRARIDSSLQWAALSATVGRLSDVRDFLFGAGEGAVFLQYPAHRLIDAQIRRVASEADFLSLTRRLADGPGVKLLVFANSRRECERLAGALHQDEKLRPHIFAHYSSLSPEVRVETERQFSASKTAVCVATSTLELGIDIGDIDAVLLWGVPGGVESFLQRIGRGNRRKNKTNVICLIPDTVASVEGEAIRFLTLIDSARKGEIPVRAPYELFGAVGQQCLNVIASLGGRYTRIADLCEVMDQHSYLERPTVETVLAELADKGYLQHHGFKNQYGAGEQLYVLQDYRMIYGNFSAGSQTVEVRHASKELGSVPAINLLRLRRGALVRFAGKRWQVRGLSAEGILVEPSEARGAAIDFTYPGGGVGFAPFLADRMWRLLHLEEFPADLLTKEVRDSVLVLKEQVQRFFEEDQIPHTRVPDGHCYLTFAGLSVNKAIALITEQSSYKADDLSLTVTMPVDWTSLPTEPQAYNKIFHQLFEATSEQSIYQSLLPRELQAREFLQDWLKDETVPQILTRLARSIPVRTDRRFFEYFIDSLEA